MVELVRSNDMVFLSWAQAMLKAEGIEAVLLDGFTSVIEGSIGAIPRRLAVLEEDLAQARELLDAAAAADANV
jgi:Putative prokaryotic signal transducing protein